MLFLTWEQSSCRLDVNRCHLYGENGTTASSLAADMEILQENVTDLIEDYQSKAQVE